ncbi:MAG: fibronectin type III domain-containing protein [Candidatus Nanopelagicales bacterium]
MRFMRRVSACALACMAFVVVAPPAHAEVSGISAWVISGATGAPDPSAVSENQIQFGIGFADSGGGPDVRFNGLSFGYTVTGESRTVASGSWPGGSGVTYISGGTAPTRYIHAVDLRDLTAGTTYTINVWAIDHGTNFTSSLQVTTPARITVPGPPSGVAAAAADTTATVTWSAPSSTGGAAITGYTATASPGGLTCSSSSTSCSIPSLTPAGTYTFTVVAANSAGTGAPSTPSAALTIPAQAAQAKKPEATAGAGTSTVPASPSGASGASGTSNADATDLGTLDPSVDTVDGELAITRSGGLFRLRVDTNSPDTPFTVTARRPGAKVLKWSLDTKGTGAVAFSTKRDLSGYTVRLRMEGQTLDVVTIPVDRTS